MRLHAKRPGRPAPAGIPDELGRCVPRIRLLARPAQAGRHLRGHERRRSGDRPENPKRNVGNPGFSPEERAKFQELLHAGFTDTFRALHPDETDAYSWWSYRFHARENNAGWRIDYFLCSDRAAEKIETASILSDIYGSDHCPVELEIAW